MIQKNSKKLICIVGPTASGKTGLAVFLAKKLSGEIVSADSRQIYRGLDIGTGKEGQPAQDAGISKSKFLISNKIPKSKNENCKLKIENLKCCQRFIDNIPQWLIDIVEPETPFTMFDWLDQARLVIEDIFSRGKLPIIVGGTGLYMQALVEGFTLQKFQNPNNKCQINFKIQIPKYRREELNKMPLQKLQSLAKKIDPIGFKKIDYINPIRLIRHIERSQSGEQMTKKKPDFEVLQIGINLPREELYQKIDQRVEKWFDAGFYDEVDNLLQQGTSIDWLNRIGLEYKILANYIGYKNLLDKNKNLKIEKLIENCKLKIENFSSFNAMKQMMKYKIHAYARRQLTWFRRFSDIKWVKNKKEALEIAKEFVV